MTVCEIPRKPLDRRIVREVTKRDDAVREVVIVDPSDKDPTEKVQRMLAVFASLLKGSSLEHLPLPDFRHGEMRVLLRDHSPAGAFRLRVILEDPADLPAPPS